MIKKKKAAKKEQRTDSKPKNIVALDIGTEFVKALIAKVKKDGTVEIIGVGRARQGLADMQSGAIADISGVVDNCDKALSEAEKMAGVDAHDVVIGIAGELVKGTTSTVRFKRSDASKHLSNEEMEMIIKKVQKRAYDNAKKRLAMELGNKDVDVRLVNSALVSIEIDGYKVTNPIGFQGKDVAIQLFTAFAPMIHVGALERTADELDLDLIAVAAEPFAVARSVIGTDSNSNLSAVLIDVGGGTTDIAVVNDGGVEGTKMFGIGGRGFTRTIANDLGVTFEDAEEKKISLSENKVEADEEEAIAQSVGKTLDVWTSGIQLALEDFKMLDHLPTRILLCGGGASLDQLVATLQDDEWHKDLPFTRHPSVKYIQPDQVSGIVDKTGRIQDHTYITAMGLLRVGLDTIVSVNEEPKSIRERFDRMLSI